jgi:hypothetical protein
VTSDNGHCIRGFAGFLGDTSFAQRLESARFVRPVGVKLAGLVCQQIDNKRLQGGAKFPTGGRDRKVRARERFRFAPEGQQIRSEAGADGYAVPVRRRSSQSG